MAISKIIYKSSSSAQGETWMDLTQDTVSDVSHIRSGYVGHLNDGTSATGSYSGTSPTLTIKSITTNGTYDAEDDNADGYSSVTVNVPSGGSSSQTATGTVAGSGTTILEIPCEFEPDLIHVYADLSEDVSLRGITTLTIIKDLVLYQMQDGSSGSASESINMLRGITGYNESSTTETHANYSNGILTIDTVSNSAGYRFTQGITYSYKLMG